MNLKITFILIIVSFFSFAQAPSGFNYQATVKNNAGALIVNQNVNFKFNIFQNTPTSIPIYIETHLVSTDNSGQVNLVIGQGTSTLGTFSQINWGIGTYYLGIELNVGSGYVAIGNKQLLSVPFALYANISGSTELITPNLSDILTSNNSANNNKIINLLNPTENQDAVTKSYADNEILTQITNIQEQINELSYQFPDSTQVTIGTQIWAKRNLDVTTYSDGTPIPEVTDPQLWTGLETGAWCYINNDSISGKTFGKLYNWMAVAGIHNAASAADPSLRKQLAPAGWHVPSVDEYLVLENYLGGQAVAGGKMKQFGTTYWHPSNFNATDESGFSGLPGGYRSVDNGMFLFLMSNGFFWTSTGDITSTSQYKHLNYEQNTLISYFSYRQAGFSVRLIKN